MQKSGRSGAGWEEPRAGGPPASGDSTNQSAKARAPALRSAVIPLAGEGDFWRGEQSCRGDGLGAASYWRDSLPMPSIGPRLVLDWSSTDRGVCPASSRLFNKPRNAA